MHRSTPAITERVTLASVGKKALDAWGLFHVFKLRRSACAPEHVLRMPQQQQTAIRGLITPSSRVAVCPEEHSALPQIDPTIGSPARHR